MPAVRRGCEPKARMGLRERFGNVKIIGVATETLGRQRGEVRTTTKARDTREAMLRRQLSRVEAVLTETGSHRSGLAMSLQACSSSSDGRWFGRIDPPTVRRSLPSP